MQNKGQATLEFTLVFVAIVVLLLGMISIWKPASDSIVRRQIRYNNSRVGAGAGPPTYDNFGIYAGYPGFDMPFRGH